MNGLLGGYKNRTLQLSESDTLHTLNKVHFSMTPLSKTLSVSRRRCSTKKKKKKKINYLTLSEMTELILSDGSESSSSSSECVCRLQTSSCFINHMISELALFFCSSLTVCVTCGTEVHVVCVPWLMLNRDIIGHYCQRSMTRYVQQLS